MRKLVFGIFFIIVAVSAFQFQENSAEAAESYTLTCRGGGDMYIEMDTASQDMFVNFTPAPNAASRRTPGPGECAWIDRPLNRSEPKKLKYTMRRSPDIVFELRRNAPVRVRSRSNSRDSLHFIRALNTEEVFHVRCYNAGSFMEVTRLGP